MNTIERTIYIGLIALMVGVVSLNYLASPKQEELWTDMVKESQQQEEVRLENQLEELEEERKFTQPVPLSVELGGYTLRADVSQIPISLERKYSGGKTVSIEIANTHGSYAEFMEEEERSSNGVPEFHKGPNGWTYYVDPYWDSTGKMMQEGGNPYRTFLKEAEGLLIAITQYDYTGGKHNKEVDNLISKIKLYGE